MFLVLISCLDILTKMLITGVENTAIKMIEDVYLSSNLPPKKILFLSGGNVDISFSEYKKKKKVILVLRINSPKPSFALYSHPAGGTVK